MWKIYFEFYTRQVSSNDRTKIRIPNRAFEKARILRQLIQAIYEKSTNLSSLFCALAHKKARQSLRKALSVILFNSCVLVKDFVKIVNWYLLFFLFTNFCFFFHLRFNLWENNLLLASVLQCSRLGVFYPYIFSMDWWSIHFIFNSQNGAVIKWSDVNKVFWFHSSEFLLINIRMSPN